MNQTLNLIANDFRYLRLFLGLWLGLVILQAVLVGSYPQSFSSRGVWPFGPTVLGWLLAILKFCLLTVIVSQAVQKDSPVGSTAFWLSRPISRGRLLASKSLFLVLAVVLPTLLVEVVLLRVCGVTPDDTLRSIPQIVLLTLLAIVVLTMLAAVTTNLPRLILWGIIALVGVPLLWFILPLILLLLSAAYQLVLGTWPYPSDDVSVAMPIPPPQYSSHLMGMLVVLSGTAAIVVGHQYLTRQTMVSKVLMVAGVFLNSLTMAYWGADWWTREPQLDPGVLNPTLLTARIEKKSLLFHPTTASGPVFSPTAEKKMLLRGRIGLDNLPPDVVALPAQISAKLLLPSGESLARHVSHSYAVTAAIPIGPDHLTTEKAELLGQVLGDVAFLDGNRQSWQAPPELFAISEDLYERYRSVSLEYSARVDFLVQRDEITRMRPEKGVRYDRGSDQVEVLSIDRSYGGGSTISLSESSHRLILDGRKDIVYLLINSSRQEAVVGWEGPIAGGSLSVPRLVSFIFPMLEVRLKQLHFDPRSDGPALDPAWFEGSELIRIETRDLGWFSKSIRVEDFVMKSVPRAPTEPSKTGTEG